MFIREENRERFWDGSSTGGLKSKMELDGELGRMCGADAFYSN
jgi:hypothetical protein